MPNSVKCFNEMMDSLLRPTLGCKPYLKTEITDPHLIREYADKIESYNSAKKSYDSLVKVHRKAQNQIHDEFKLWALKECGIEGHEYAEKAWNMAYERGHSNGGFESVLDELEELSELMT